jgi:hypothetical protein
MPFQHNGKSMSDVCTASARAYSHIFNSSQEQRPHKVQQQSDRIGPQTYHTNKPWLRYDRDGTLRATPAFKDTQLKLKPQFPSLTAEVDFVGPDRLACLQLATNSLPWSTTPQRVPQNTHAAVDKIYDPSFGKTASLERQLETTARTYAAVFNSQQKRFKQRAGDVSAELGPGKYDIPTASIAIKNPNHATPTFKSSPWYKVKPLHTQQVHQAPDAIYSPAFAREAWARPGFAYSTRERFPRLRPTWNS